MFIYQATRAPTCTSKYVTSVEADKCAPRCRSWRNYRRTWGSWEKVFASLRRDCFWFAAEKRKWAAKRTGIRFLWQTLSCSPRFAGRVRVAISHQGTMGGLSDLCLFFHHDSMVVSWFDSVGSLLWWAQSTLVSWNYLLVFPGMETKTVPFL